MGTIRPAYYTDELKVGMTAFQSKRLPKPTSFCSAIVDGHQRHSSG